MKKAILKERLFGIKSGEVFRAYINKGNEFIIAFIDENGEIVSYYSADLIESEEEWKKGNFQLEVVGDDFKIEKEG